MGSDPGTADIVLADGTASRVSMAPLKHVGSPTAASAAHHTTGRGLPGRGLPRKQYTTRGSETGLTAYSNQSEVLLEDLDTVAGPDPDEA